MVRSHSNALNLSMMELQDVSDWWKEINESIQWQDGIFYFLCAAYALVSSVALIQLIRIELRVPEYGWTTQKVFHLMNFIVNGVRAIVFGFHKQVFAFKPKVFSLVLLDLPGILFFSTYTLLVLFWAEIYHQARSLPTDKLRIVYISVNAGVYFIQVCIWVYLWINDSAVVESIGKLFIAVISFIAALGFLLYGGGLFFMLRRFPIESKGRRKKLHEVGSVTAICFTCFLIRCVVIAQFRGKIGRFGDLTAQTAVGIMNPGFFLNPRFHYQEGFVYTDHIRSGVTKVIERLASDVTFAIEATRETAVSAFDSEANLEVLDHPILNLIYYMFAEVMPSALVLYILRKLPPKRVSAQYHPIH